MNYKECVRVWTDSWKTQTAMPHTRKLQLAVVQIEELHELRDDGVAGFGQDLDQHILVQRVERHHHREPAHEFGNHSEFDQISRLNLLVTMKRITNR